MITKKDNNDTHAVVSHLTKSFQIQLNARFKNGSNDLTIKREMNWIIKQ